MRKVNTEGYRSAKVGCIVVVACLVVFGHLINARGEEWILYEMDDDYVFYYDKESVSTSDKGIVKMWTKTIYREKGGASEKCEQITATKERWEIDCVNSQHRLLAHAEYGNDGQVIRCEQNDIID